MTDLDIVLTEVQQIKKTLDTHGGALEKLADATNKMSVQNEQITSLQGQTNALWRKVDELLSPKGIITEITRHQSNCPKEEMQRTFTWVWRAITLQSGIIAILIGAVLKIAGVS